MNAPAAADRLPVSLKVGWGFGSVGTITVLNVNALLLLFFMTAVLGIAPAVAGTMLFAAKLVDAVLAPALGTISDRTRSRWGRRRPYMLAGAFVCGAAVAAIFNPPAFGPAGVQAWIMACLLVLAVGYTLFNVPYIAMPAEMTESPVERTSIMSWRIAFVSLGGLVTGFAPQFARMMGGGRDGYGATGLVVAAVLFVAMLVAVLASGRARATVPVADGEPGGLARFTVVFGNRPFLLLIAAKIMQLVGLASLTASALFLFKHALAQNEAMLGLYIMASTLASIASMPVWVALNRRFEKRTLYICGCLGFAGVTLTWLLAGPGEPAALVIGRGASAGLFSGGLLLMGQSILPDTIDYDCRRSGVRREGVYAGAYSLVEKGSMAFGPLLIGLILQSFGFQAAAGGAVAQSAEAVRGIYIGAALIPAMLYALSTIPLFFYDLTASKLKAARADPGLGARVRA